MDEIDTFEDQVAALEPDERVAPGELIEIVPVCRCSTAIEETALSQQATRRSYAADRGTCRRQAWQHVEPGRLALQGRAWVAPEGRQEEHVAGERSRKRSTGRSVLGCAFASRNP